MGLWRSKFSKSLKILNSYLVENEAQQFDIIPARYNNIQRLGIYSGSMDMDPSDPDQNQI